MTNHHIIYHINPTKPYTRGNLTLAFLFDIIKGIHFTMTAKNKVSVADITPEELGTANAPQIVIDEKREHEGRFFICEKRAGLWKNIPKLALIRLEMDGLSGTCRVIPSVGGWNDAVTRWLEYVGKIQGGIA